MSHPIRLKPLALLISLALLQAAHAVPLASEGTVVGGSASISNPTAGQLLVVTSTPNTIINWNSFSNSSGQTIRFEQPSATSNVLNRVTGTGASLLNGTLQSVISSSSTTGGRVFLVNPNGVILGSTATINVGSLIASTLDISNANFMSENFAFSGTSTAQVRNEATIVMPNGGKVFLVGKDVINAPGASITANSGEIWLAAGGNATAIDQGSPELTISYTAPAGQATNIGQLIASSGSIGLLGNTVVAEGQITANTVSTVLGRIYLRAESGSTVGSGATIQASSGAISIDAKTGGVLLDPGSVISAGAGVVGIKGVYIDQSASAGTGINAAGLGVYATNGSIELDGPGNSIAKLSVKMDAAGGETMRISNNHSSGMTITSFYPAMLRKYPSTNPDSPVTGVEAGSNTVELVNTGLITQDSPIRAGYLAVHSSNSPSGAIDLQNPGNTVQSLNAYSGGSINFVNTGNLTMTGTSTTIASGAPGAIMIKTINGNLTLDSSAVVSSAGDNTGINGAAVVLATDQNFVNNNTTAGANAILTPNGRWLIYAVHPSSTVPNGLTGTEIFGCSLSGCAPSTVSQAGNVFLWMGLTAPQQTVVNQNQGMVAQTPTVDLPQVQEEPEPAAKTPAPTSAGSDNADTKTSPRRFMCSA